MSTSGSLLANDEISTKTKIPLISVIAPEWEGQTHANGEGLYWELIRAIYEPEGIKVRTRNAPWRRAMKMVTKYRLHHAIAGEYQDSEEALLFPKYPLDLEKMIMVTLKRRQLNVINIADFKGKHVSWRKGYDLLDAPAEGFHLKEFRNMDMGIELLVNGDVDILIDEPDEIERALASINIPAETLDIKPYPNSKYIYLGFNESATSERLIKIYNERTEALIESGVLQKIYDKWNTPVPEVLKRLR